MRRNAVAWIMLAALGGLGGCASGPETGGSYVARNGRGHGPPSVPGVQGPYGQPVAMVAPYDTVPPASRFQAQQMMARSVPMSMMQSGGNGPGPFGPPGANMPNPMFPRGGVMSPPGMPFAPGMSPGPGPGLAPANFTPNPTGGAGLVNANIPPGMTPPGGVVLAQHAHGGPGANPGFGGVRFQSQRTQVRFSRPTGMKISWFTVGPDGKPAYSTTPIEAPGRYNFAQAAIYRLKLTGIEGRPGLEVYPSMEVVPSNPKTEAFLAHSAVPVEFTNEDFKQIADGNYVIKVIYLPDPQFQDLAGTGTDEILSTRLEPGADPILEALRRGCILAVIRMGNVDQEAPNTPALNVPGPNAQPMPMPPHGPQQQGGFQVPYYGNPGMPHPGGPMPGMPMPGPGGQFPGPVGTYPGMGGAVNVQQGPMSIPTGPGPNAPKGPAASTMPREPMNVPTIPVVPASKESTETPGGPSFPPTGPNVTPTPAPAIPPPPTSSVPPPTMPTTGDLPPETAPNR